ncbi:VOC family protein [Leisingera sp. JC1]|uniref:VOC family protein n=1 Tax=Leisingera sp. JC1 TaxID=1855282 RepID=UPI0008036B0E|nr:VOC family protein [Leisingera sp. JC1]OBY25665.1 dioxygenase [Leisingera sp. JC1]
MHPFHLAFPVTDLEETRRFFIEKLGCAPGRESVGEWLDFDFFGHQMSAHLQSSDTATGMGAVDGDAVPIPHFGVVLDMETFDALSARLEADALTNWIMRPKRRMIGEPGEQATLFVRDPSGNGIEFKAFANRAALFAH